MVTISYMLVAMWAAFVAGGATSEVMNEYKRSHGDLYKIQVDYSGQTISTCKENEDKLHLE